MMAKKTRKTRSDKGQKRGPYKTGSKKEQQSKRSEKKKARA